LVTRPRHEARGGVHHPFLDLVPADRRAAHRLGDLVGKRRLPRANGTADHDERRAKGHAHRAILPRPRAVATVRPGGRPEAPMSTGLTETPAGAGSPRGKRVRWLALIAAGCLGMPPARWSSATGCCG